MITNYFTGYNSPVNGSSLDCLSLIVQSISSPDSSSPHSSPSQSHNIQQMHLKTEYDAKVN